MTHTFNINKSHTHVTRCVVPLMPTMLYTKIDSQCDTVRESSVDKLATFAMDDILQQHFSKSRVWKKKFHRGNNLYFSEDTQIYI